MEQAYIILNTLLKDVMHMWQIYTFRNVVEIAHKKRKVIFDYSFLFFVLH